MIQTDIAAVPLKAHSVDVVVFSLSLMGTNFPDFLHEANRVLRKGGLVFIAEVVSRFTDVQEFCKHLKEEAGFATVQCKQLKGFFYLMILRKESEVRERGDWSQAFAK